MIVYISMCTVCRQSCIFDAIEFSVNIDEENVRPLFRISHTYIVHITTGKRTTAPCVNVRCWLNVDVKMYLSKGKHRPDAFVYL